MLDVFTTYYAENPGSLMQLAICVGLFAACYIISRVVRYKVCPWLVAKSEKRIKKVLFIFVRGFEMCIRDRAGPDFPARRCAGRYRWWQS